ncbi:hypothetical protein TWF281_001371 [Arthrobotrys megalospora]
MEDFYKILELAPTASAEEIKKSYKSRALITHPDKNGNTEVATKLFQKVQAAFECLSDPLQRKAYDQTRSNSSSPSSECASKASSNPSATSTEWEAPEDLEEQEARLYEQWKQHTLQRNAMDALKQSLKCMKDRIENLKQSLEKEIKRFKKFQKDKKPYYESSRNINIMKTSLEKLQQDAVALEAKTDEWDREEVRILYERVKLGAKLRARREAEKREREEEQERREIEYAEKMKREREKREERERQNKEHAAAEQDRRKKEAAERWRRCQEEAEKCRQTQQERIEALRKERFKEQQRRLGAQQQQQQQPREPQTRQDPKPATECRHTTYWDKIQVQLEACSKCRRKFGGRIFKCPKCQTKACAPCRDQLKRSI